MWLPEYPFDCMGEGDSCLVNAGAWQHTKTMKSIPPALLLRQALVWDPLCCSYLFRVGLQRHGGNEDWKLGHSGHRSKGSAHSMGPLCPRTPFSVGGIFNNSPSPSGWNVHVFGGQDSSYNCRCLRVLEGTHKKTKANLACRPFGGFIFGQPKDRDCELSKLHPNLSQK